MNIRKILLLCFSILIAMIVIGCTSDAIPSDVPSNDKGLKTTPLSIYFQREDGIYRYNELGDTLEWFTYLPQGNIISCFVDEARNTIYYAIEKGPIYLFCKTDISTGQETVIASDVGFGRGNIYNGCIYFYDFVSDYVTEYNIQTGNLKRFQSSHEIDGNGTVKIYDGNIYFFSTKLHHIFSDDSGTKVIADRKNYSFRGYFYDNNIFYMDELGDGKDGIIKLDLNTNKKTIIDSFLTEKEENEINDGKVLSDYFFIKEDTIYYSYNNCTYKISVNGNGKEKIADFPIMGDMYMVNGKLLWYYAESQDFGVGGPTPLNEYELHSYDLITKKVKNYSFNYSIPIEQAYEYFLQGNAFVQFNSSTGGTSYYKLSDLYNNDHPLKQFSIFDMNKDDIAELHLLSNDGYNVVTWKDGRLFLIHQGTAYEKPLFNGAILYTRYGGAPTHIDYQYITLDFENMNSTAVSFQKYQSSNEDYDNESAYDTFYFDETPVSKDKWYQLTNQYLSYFPAQIVLMNFSGKTSGAELIPRFMPTINTYDGFSANNLNALGLTSEELQLAGIPLSIAESEITKYIAEKPLSVTTKRLEEYAREETRIYTYSSGLVLLLSDPEKQNEWHVFKIEATSPAYQTPRGLKVTDDIKLVKKLYGEPNYGYSETTRTEDGEWDYSDERGAYFHATFTIKGGIVTKISVFLVC